MENNYNIIPSFQKTLFDSSIDFAPDLLELGIDSIMEDGLFKDVPIIGSILGLCKLGCNFHDRNLIKQTLHFIDEFNKGSISDEKLKKYKEKLEKNKFNEEELGRVLIILNRTIETKKSRILARFYCNYIDDKIEWDIFCDFATTLEALNISDIPLFIKIIENQRNPLTERQLGYLTPLKRLTALGLICDFQNEPQLTVTKDYPDRTSYKTHLFGQKFYECGLK